MYTRELKNPPAQIIVDGKPQFGTYSSAPATMDIRGVKHPFRVLPMPTFITNLRIRCSISTMIVTEEYVGSLYILDARFFSYSELIFWKRKTGQKYSYRHVSGIRRRVVPKNLENALCTIRAKKRYIKIKWDRKKKLYSILFNLTGDKYRPSFSGSLLVDTNSTPIGHIFNVNPAPTTARCSALVQTAAPVLGTFFIQQKDTPILPHELKGQMFFNIRRIYAKLRSKQDQVTGAGTIGDKNICFQISLGSASSFDKYNYNDNVLFCNGETTPLPPVVITYPFGITGKWIIQDTENMIDLSFTPISDNLRTLSIFILRSKHHTMYGHFNGVLLTKDGESIPLKDFPGIATAHRIRF